MFFHRTGPVRDWLLVLAIVLRKVIELFVGVHGASPVLNREFMAWKWWRGMIQRYFMWSCLTICRGITGLSVFRGIKVSRGGGMAISYHSRYVTAISGYRRCWLVFYLTCPLNLLQLFMCHSCKIFLSVGAGACPC